MKKLTFSNKAIAILLVLMGLTSYGQNFEPFAPRFDEDLKGDILLIGNNILGPNNNAFNSDNVYNHNVNMVYIDIDGDNTTFSSSSADLEIPNPNCYAIRYAGLYWSAVNPGNEPILNVKFKGPTGPYTDIQGSIIYDANGTSVDGGNSFSYACYADVTNLVTGLGTYTVANVSSGQGETSTFNPYNGTGQSAGWSLFVVYEDPTLPGKSITSFDGFSAIRAATNATLDINISGFRTVPAPAPVRANFAFATLEGDKPISGDQLLLNGVSLSATDRPVNNFFNSSVTQLSALPTTNRVPNSTNTLGFDTGILAVPNPANSVIANDATSAVVQLKTTGDTYFQYFFAFAVDIIEPTIVLTKIVEDDAGNDIGGQTVGLSAPLNYVIGFQNIGNDNATNFQIRDILPINIVFNYPGDLVLPPGVTVISYNPVTRELILSIENYLVEVNDPIYEIRIEVETVDSCQELEDACSNIINNQAFASYNGTLNPTFLITDDPSLNSNTGCLLSPQATNFLADLDDCTFSQDEILCGASLEMTAADGYDVYTWSTSNTGTPVIGTSQTVTVTETGTYYVFNTAIAPCQSIVQEFVVTLFGGDIDNPVIPYADEVTICPNDGKLLPNIFLCGADDFRDIQTNLSGTTSIIWEQLNEASCTAVSNTDCANESNSCTWNQVSTDTNYVANTAGQFRLTINYPGGCFVQFYFNVYQNLLNPTVIATDIICTDSGSIMVNDVPSGYEYSLDNITFQNSPIFVITTPGTYTVYIRQINVTTNPCVFTVPDIQIRMRDFTVSTTVTQPLCYGDKGSIQLAANDVEPQYSYTLSLNGSLVNSVGPILENTYAFNNLNPGTYTATVTTENGCTYTEIITIIAPPELTVTAALTTPFTCLDGEITIYPVGGTPPYFYYVNSTTVFQTVPEFAVSLSDVYNITIIDSNNCSASTTITVDELPEPEYTITQTAILCYNDATGTIQINTTNVNGYALEYSIDNGTTFTTSPIFTNLTAGNYNVIINYTLGAVQCSTASEVITLLQPNEALTATAGISELAGCGPNGEGTIRITNPQGGTPFPAPDFYEYSFDNQATWTTLNSMYILPGTYTVYIRDANGCVFAMQDIILDQAPPVPSITVSDTIFNCDGSGNATVTVTNTGSNSYSYDYYLDGVPNPNTTDPQTFINVPSGTHTISVEYTLLTIPTYSNLLYETFGYGNDTTSPGINPVYYCFEQQVAATQCNNAPTINDGEYSVTSAIQFPFGAWISPVDYTPATTPITPDGRFMVVNIGATIPATEVLYEKQINNIIPNQPIQVEFAAINLLKAGNTQFNPNLRVALVDGSGTEISFYDTGDIPKTENWIAYPITPITLDPGSNTSLKFILRSNVQQTSGNDVAIDDLKVFQLPIACATVTDFPFIVPSGNAFTASITATSMISCSGATDGTITLAAQNFNTTNGFQYSIDNGATWITQLTSPHIITGLTNITYTVQIRYDDTPTTCEFDFTEIIGAPDPLSIVLTNTEVTCINGATITATTTGGTPGYTYQLIDTVAPFTTINFQANGVITNVTNGSYTVEVTDSNGCTESTTITLNAPTMPVASISIASDLCYDSVNGATIDITASSGQAPYQFNINGGPFQTSNVFTNLIPGNYTIIVQDSYGCEVTLPVQTIELQLIVGTVITKGLDCTATPDAIITGTISGGTAPYTYEVSVNGGAYTTLGVASTPFNYTTATAGNFQFMITDALGCTATSTLETINVISLPEIITVTETQSILCNGDSNGAIDINVNQTVGTPVFTLNVYNNTTATDYGTQTAGLTAGTYTITLTDGNACTDTDTITINQPDAITVNYSAIPITCTSGGTSQGSVIVDNVTGGTSPYNYFVTGTNGYSNSELNNTGSTSVSFDVVDFGLYQINIVDANGCSVLVQDILVASPPDDLDIIINATANCTTGGEATVSVNTALAGSGPFYFDIYNGTIPPPPPAGTWQTETTPGSTTFTGLTTGIIYTFIVYDNLTGCYYFESATTPIPSNATLTIDALSANNITCNGSADGNTSFTVNNPEAIAITVDYEIFNSLSLTTTGILGNGTVAAGSSLSISNLGPLNSGNYYILVTETSGPNAGCSIASAAFNITEAAFPLILSTSIDQNANCNPNSGIISAIGQFGTAPYLYQITTTPAAPIPSDTAWNANHVFNINAGSYYIHVIDAFGCIITSNEQILIADPTPIVTATISNLCTAAEGEFEIDVALPTLGIAPHSYSIDGGTFQTQTPPFTISNLTSGNHTVEVQDANGCGNLVSVNITAPIGLSAIITASPTCADNDGSISLTSFGGSGTYTYTISPNPASITLTGTVFSGVPSGTYTITITDAITTCNTTSVITLEPATPVTFTLDAVNLTCNGDSSGVITVNLPISNDNPIYTYQIIAPSILAVQSSNVFTNLGSGTYTIQVNSGKNCTATETVTITEPNAISVTAPTVVQYNCVASNAVNFATITVSSVSGGSGTYNVYEFVKDGNIVQSGSNTVYIETDSSGGSYIINVYDDLGCMGSTAVAVIINPYINLEDITLTIDSAITCTNLEDITITASTTGGIPTNLEYTVEDVAGATTGGTYSTTNTTGIFTGLDVGNYIITLENLDTGCGLDTVHFVNNPNTFDININVLNDVTCYNGTDASIDITFMDLDISSTSPDQAGPFNYTITDDSGTVITTGTTTDAGPVTITGLSGGTYTVSTTLISNPFCTVNKNFTITRPVEALTLTAAETSNVTCTNDAGTITAFATGGWGNLEYELTGAATVAYTPNNTFTGLSAGNYTVNVRDFKGCILSVDIILVVPTPILATVIPNTTMLSCYGDQNGTITISSVTGGQGSNYTYTLNTILPTPSTSGPQTSNTFNDLAAGTYNITITDGYNCSFTSLNIILDQPTQIQASLAVLTPQTCLVESTLTLSATGGVGPYTYSNTTTFATVLGAFTNAINFEVPVGTYQYFVKDVNGCVANVSNEITIDVLPNLIINLYSDTPTINCAGDNNGSIIATAQGGLGNYVYTIEDVNGNTVSATENSPGVFTNLVANTYVIQVTSGDCITVSNPITITEPANPLTANFNVNNITCSGSNDGVLEIIATGGTGIIKYAISPQLNQFFDTNVFENLTVGNYEVVVQDVLGCFVTFQFEITEPLPVMLSIVPNSIFEETCDGDADGSFSIDITGGTLPYSVNLDDNSGPYTVGNATQTVFDFNDLNGGDHLVFIQDANGCESEWNITFPKSVKILPFIEIDNNCENNTLTSTVTVLFDDSITDMSELQFSLNGNTPQSSNIFTNIEPGDNHFIQVDHIDGCTQFTEIFSIENYQPLMLILIEGNQAGEIIAQTTGGTGVYDYVFNNESYEDINQFTATEIGEYIVTVSDSYGCEAQATITINVLDPCIINHFTPNGDGVADTWSPGCIEDFPNLTFDIFDRYGRKIATYLAGQYWDGKYNGTELPTGDYWYVVQTNSQLLDKKYVGNITLYR